MPTSPYHVIARVARDVVRRAHQAAESDLADDVKGACARYHIPYDSDLVAKAVRSELWKIRRTASGRQPRAEWGRRRSTRE
jgi:hypothetical protein